MIVYKLLVYAKQCSTSFRTSERREEYTKQLVVVEKVIEILSTLVRASAFVFLQTRDREEDP